MEFILFAGFLLLFGTVSRRIQTTVVTGPMVFVIFGLVIGGVGLGVFDFDYRSEIFTTIADLTLVLVLFADASRIDLRALIREQNLPIRMLTIGLSLTIAAGTGVGLLLLTELSFWESVTLAVILTPTDAALAQAVISSQKLPARLRQALNVESGLNDGVALPLLILFLVLSGHFHGHQDGNLALFAVGQLTIGPVFGIAVGYGGGKLLLLCHRRGWIDHSFLSLSAVALAILTYSGAEMLGGNGFIAAFVAGLVVGNVAREICTTLYNFAEAEGQLLVLFTFVVFAATMVPVAIGGLTWMVVLYSVLSLTTVRMIPVAVSLVGTRLMWESTAIVGWFGPRGIASIIYLLIVVRESTLPGETTIVTVTVATILLSVFLHGATAVPLANRYERMMNRMEEADPDDMDDMPEMKPVSEMRVRKQM